MTQTRTLGGEGGQGRKGSPGSPAQPKAGGEAGLAPHIFHKVFAEPWAEVLSTDLSQLFAFIFLNLTEFLVGIKFRQNETCRVFFLFLSFVGKLHSHSIAKDARELLILLP